MTNRSVFADEWRDCLRAQYLDVIRSDDQVTLRTLKDVMYEVGFTETELKELYMLATMHVDDVPEGFVPDIDLIAPPAPVDETPFVSLPEPLVEPEAEDEAADADDEPPPPASPHDPQQMSLF